MERAGASTRRRAQEKTWLLVRTRFFLTFCVALVVAVVVGFGGWLAVLDALDHWPSAMTRGFVAGAILASAGWGVALVLLRYDGGQSWRRGAQGEERTAELLDRLGPEWRTVHNVPFAFEHGSGEVDVDHIAIGPYGVLVVESKVCTESVDLAARHQKGRVVHAIRQAEGNAGRVRALVGSKIDPSLVIPLVVFWGRNVENGGDPVVRIGSVRVVRGRDADAWLHRISGDRVTPEERDRVAAHLLTMVDRYERSVGRRGRGAETTEWLEQRCRRVGIIALAVGGGSVAAVLALADVKTTGSNGWVISLLGITFGLAVPAVVAGLAMWAWSLGGQLRARGAARWWRWPAVTIAMAVIYVARLFTLG
ncbi:MAG: nuclease-related domain-containing protein [Acidimicrobiales bacterium]